MNLKKAARRVLSAVLGVVMLSALLVPLSAHGQNEGENESENGKIRVGFFAMDGYHNEDENGVRSGCGYEFLQLLARYSDMSFEYVGYDKSWEEMQQMLLSGQVDMLTCAQKSEEREKLFAYSDTLVGTSAAVLTVKSGDTRYLDGNYQGIRVGLVKGSSRNSLLDSFMAEKGFSYTPLYFDSINDLSAALQLGRDIDAAMTNTLRLAKNEVVLETLDAAPYYVITRKEDSALMAGVNAAMLRMDTDSAGWRTRLKDKYYISDAGENVVFTADERAYLSSLSASGRVLRVAVNPDCAPYSFFENGEARGVIPDIFALVAQRMGIDYTVVECETRKDYHRICTDGSADIILDGMDDYYTLESNGLEMSDVYYSTPLAVLTTKNNVEDVSVLAQPEISLLNEACFAYVYSADCDINADYDSYGEIVADIKKGHAEGSYMPYYCAQLYSASDYTGSLQCLMLPRYERSFVYAVNSLESYNLLSALNKAAQSLSEEDIAAIVASNTSYADERFSLIAFVYKNIVLVFALAVLFLAVLAAALFFAGKSKRTEKELERSRRLERYIGYLCDVHYKVLEVDLDLGTRRQYMKRNDKVEIDESVGFTAFDIDSIHPDDRDEVLKVFDPEVIRGFVSAGVGERYVESRMKDEHGEYRYFSFLLKLIPVDEQHPCSAILLIKDINALRQEREHNHDLLVNALDAANAASRSKSVFLSSMSHEIRTPLNAMIGYMTIAQTAIDNRDKVLHCIDSASVAARHLLSIINDVLDLSSMESGKMKLARERFDLKEQISSVTTLFYQQCKTKSIKFDVTVDDLTEEWVVGDAMRVSQILMNLMSNAVKFTSKGAVSLTVKQTRRTIEQVFISFTVKDSGIGMSEEYMSRLFQPFEQESADTSRRYGGTGLGMSITRNLVNLMGGSLDVASVQGEGSTFAVTLPFIRTENHDNAPHRDISSLKVLVVDDMQNECDYVHALLKRLGVPSESARSGEAALRMVAERKDTPERFDLCIIDWNMPGLNGVETTKMIHDQCDPDIPIIIATAYDVAEFEQEALSAGARRIISKPLFQSTLLDLLVSDFGKYATETLGEGEIPNLSDMHVLLAEDNETNAEVATDLLDLAGITVEVVQNGRQAVDMFAEKGERFDAILMDVQMPVMDGYAATRLIRESAHPRAKSVPIIALTADAFAENVAAALAAGMDEHISKPIETKRLFSVLKKIYDKSRKDDT